jgi:hypothetical protein
MCVHQGNWSINYFFVVPLSSFGIRGILASYNEFGSIPSLSILWNRLANIGISFSLKVW